jgi:ketosteroid isomerase-like protein
MPPDRNSDATMASEWLALVRRAYDAWNRDDFEAVVPEFHPEIEWQSAGIFPGLEPEAHGIDGVRAWWRALKEPWESFTIEIRDHWETEDALVTWVGFDAIGKGSGVEVSLEFAHVFEFEDGLVRRYRSFRSLAEAFEAAGIDSPSDAA